MARLPKTDAKLTTSITIRALKEEVNVDTLSDVAAVQALSESSVKIGAVRSFSEASPRTTIPRYEIDADKAGDIVERIPQLVDRTLRINRAILYTADMFQAFGFTDINDITDQNKPFVIVKSERAPEGSGVVTRTTVYSGCWFHDNPKTYDMGGDLQVLQDVEIGYTRKYVS
jgi:hypothetical protein